MSGLLGYVPIVGRLIGTQAAQRIDLPPAKVYDIETLEDHSGRSLKHLIRANHSNYALLYGNAFEHENNLSALLVSAYMMGANNVQLHALYDEFAKVLGTWEAAPSEMIDDDWQDFYGDRRYQRAYVDFFEDALVMKFNYDWRRLLSVYLFEGPKPLVYGLVGCSGNPLIQLACAYQVGSKELAAEALALAGSQYGFISKYVSNESYAKSSANSSDSIAEILRRLNQDERFNHIFTAAAPNKMAWLLKNHEDLMLEYWNAWTLTEPAKQFRESQELVVALLVATAKRGTRTFCKEFAHLVATNNAVRVLVQFLPKEYHVCLLRAWWMLALSVYVTMLRPEIIEDYAEPAELKGRDWAFVENMAVESALCTDAAFVTTLRAVRDIAQTWGDAGERLLLAAVIFAEEFSGWSN
ncbi:hypothetical protein TD95_002983 [Thielaviopsis punctulata]|uniref:Questin oxidase family protein n=1 Tax=Thielaviopsis punctulata TaxID=72032 RepID=A0A0F4ZHG4_9PEZI|nr:hypothetical protein TD95_002983 [Thielaviopsis punctulata]